MFSLRWSLALGLVLLLGEVAAASPYSDAVLADGPLAYWRLGDAGSTVTDIVGGNNGTGGANVMFNQPSLLPLADPGNAAIRLPASGTGVSANRVEIPGFQKYPAGSTGYTTEFWIQVNGGAGSTASLVSDGESGGDFYFMTYNIATGNVRPHYDGLSPVSQTTTSSPLADGGIHHVVTTLDSLTGEANIYIDGALDSTVTDGGLTGVPGNTTNAIFFGTDNREPGLDIFLDEVAFYNFALSADQVANHFLLGTSLPPALTPEPASLGLFALAFAGLFAFAWRQRRGR